MAAAWEILTRPIGGLRSRIGPLAPRMAGALRAARPALRFLLRIPASLSRLWRAFQGRPVSKKSLCLRLSVFFTAFLAVAWLIAAAIAWVEWQSSINEFFDTQQLLFAERLAETDFTHSAAILPRPKDRPYGLGKHDMGDMEDDALGFAVFTASGAIVMADAKNGQHFAFRPDKRGFSDEPLAGKKDGAWRVVRLATQDGRHIVAVGQEVEYRRDMVLEMLGNQLVPWVALLPVLLLGFLVILGRELAPLRGLAERLRARTPDDTSPLEVRHVPSEALPMAEALNGFFAKTNTMLARERSFISDAAHELRTPLAGLRVQAQVAAQKGIDEHSRGEALGFLQQGIDRCARLVEQLLALSRLDAMHEAAEPDTPFAGLSRGAVHWPLLLDDLMKEYRPKAERKQITLEYAPASLNASTEGYPVIISMLLRNLLDNAVRYSPPHGRIHIALDGDSLTIENTAPELPESCASRLGERFFRPPGQEEHGSGLGLSIVKRITEIHRFGLIVRTSGAKPDGAAPGFCVTLNFAEPASAS